MAEKPYWEHIQPFETFSDKEEGVVVASASKVGRLWGPVRMTTPLPGRSRIMSNFVHTADGVGSYGIAGYSGGGVISKSPADRWMMDVWRMHADAVLVGAETIRVEDAEFKHKIAEGTFSFAIDGTPVNGFAITVEDPDLAEWRKANKGARHPLVVIFSGKGDFAEDLGIFCLSGQKIVIFTTSEGEARLSAMMKGKEKFANTEVIPWNGPRDGLPQFAAETLLKKYKVVHTVVEGGPSTAGDFLKMGILDDDLQTIAPRLGVGKDEKGNPRKRIFEGPNFYPQEAFSDKRLMLPDDARPSPELARISLKGNGDHTFIRYWVKGN